MIFVRIPFFWWQTHGQGNRGDLTLSPDPVPCPGQSQRNYNNVILVTRDEYAKITSGIQWWQQTSVNVSFHYPRKHCWEPNFSWDTISDGGPDSWWLLSFSGSDPALCRRMSGHNYKYHHNSETWLTVKTVMGTPIRAAYWDNRYLVISELYCEWDVVPQDADFCCGVQQRMASVYSPTLAQQEQYKSQQYWYHQFWGF